MAGPHRRRRGPQRAPRKIEIRLTEAEHQAIRKAAAAPGRGVSMARFVAEAALEKAGERPPPREGRRLPSRLVLAELLDAVTAVNRIGNNLNQLARERNATGVRPVGTAAEVQRALEALERLAEVARGAAR